MAALIFTAKFTRIRANFAVLGANTEYISIYLYSVARRGGSRIFIGEGLQVLGGALLAIEGAPLPLTVTMHYNENYEMLVSL